MFTKYCSANSFMSCLARISMHETWLTVNLGGEECKEGGKPQVLWACAQDPPEDGRSGIEVRLVFGPARLSPPPRRYEPLQPHKGVCTLRIGQPSIHVSTKRSLIPCKYDASPESNSTLILVSSHVLVVWMFSSTHGGLKCPN